MTMQEAQQRYDNMLEPGSWGSLKRDAQVMCVECMKMFWTDASYFSGEPDEINCKCTHCGEYGNNPVHTYEVYDVL